jgi:hypothetical protein
MARAVPEVARSRQSRATGHEANAASALLNAPNAAFAPASSVPDAFCGAAEPRAGLSGRGRGHPPAALPEG